MTPPNPSGIPPHGNIATRSRAATQQSNPDDVPEPTPQPTTIVTPQPPLYTPTEEQEVAIEDLVTLATVGNECKQHVEPINQKIDTLETGLNANITVTEDARTHIGMLESTKEQFESMSKKVDGLTSTEEDTRQMIDLFPGLKSEWETTLSTLRTDVNRILENNSQSCTIVQDTTQTNDESDKETQEEVTPQSEKRVTFPTPKKDHPEQGGQSSKKPSSSKPSSSSRSKKTRSKKSTRTTPRSGISRKYYDTYDSTSSDTSEDESARETSDYQAPTPTHEQEKVEKFQGLASIIPTERRYDMLMSYRCHRLRNTSLKSTDSHDKLRRALMDLELTFKDQKFSGEDPVLVFDFLARLVDEADMLGLTEGQLLAILPNLVTGTAQIQYRATVKGSRRGGLTAWPQAVQYFLRTYATTTAIRTATHHFRNMKQMADEDGATFAARVNLATFRCGNVHTDEEKMTTFIDGLDNCIRTAVARFRDDQFRHEMTFERLVHYAKDEGDSFRSGLGINHVLPNSGTGTGTSRLLRTQSPPASAFSLLNATNDNTGQLLLGHEDDGEAQTSIPMTDLPSEFTTEEIDKLNEEQEQFLLAQTSRQRVLPARVTFDQSGKPGWYDTEKKGDDIIFYGCYMFGDHILPKCTVSSTQYEKVIENYDKLTDVQKQRCPDRHIMIARNTKEFVEQFNKIDSIDEKTVGTQVNPSPAPKNG